jgi:hypothetical protein
VHNYLSGEVSMLDLHNLTKELYSLVHRLPPFGYYTDGKDLPENGIYLFFERGEDVKLQDNSADRIVRVGTHKSDFRFRGRIRQHYGNRSSLKGNKNGSVFRKHLGGALLRRLNLNDYRLNDWLTQDGPTFIEVEEKVSQVLRENFTFVCFRVDTKEDRLNLERALIAQLAQYSLGLPSKNWLGLYADSEKIRKSGLWNTQHIDAAPMKKEEFDRFRVLVESTLSEEVS